MAGLQESTERVLQWRELMPLFWFHIESPLPTHTVMARIRSIVGPAPAWPNYSWKIWEQPKPYGPPFTGTVRQDSFKVQPVTWGRNSFLPVIHGRVFSEGLGTRLRVIMYLHPVTAAIVAFISWVVLRQHFHLRRAATSGNLFYFPIILALMAAAGFFPEALQAKRLISDTVLHTNTDQVRDPPPLG